MDVVKKQQVIDGAKAKGFIAIDEETIDYNYNMALEFEKLSPAQQSELTAMTKA